MQFEPIAEGLALVDLAKLAVVTGAQTRSAMPSATPPPSTTGTSDFSFKNLGAWAATGAVAAAAPCLPTLATGPWTYAGCVALGAVGASVWNTASQTGILNYGK